MLIALDELSAFGVIVPLISKHTPDVEKAFNLIVAKYSAHGHKIGTVYIFKFQNRDCGIDEPTRHPSVGLSDSHIRINIFRRIKKEKKEKRNNGAENSKFTIIEN